MKNRVILQNGRYALIEREKEYVVACGYDGDEWSQGYYFTYWNDVQKKALCLAGAIDYFRSFTESDYISRSRLEELATKLKDGLIEDDEESAMEYFDEECEMTEQEKQWFCISDKLYGC